MSPLEEKLETLNALKSTIISAEAASVFSEEVGLMKQSIELIVLPSPRI